MKLTAVAQAVSAAAERLNTIVVSAQEKRMAAGIATSPMVLAYEIGQWILRVNRLDPVVVTDGTGVLGELFLDFFKTKTDDTVLADTVAKEFHKALRDEAGLSDVQIMGFFKALGDQTAVSEAYTLHLTKPLADLSQALDEAVVAFYKALVEDVGFSDAEVMAFGKVLTEAPALSDHVYFDLVKPIEDGLGVLEAHALHLSRTIHDHITVTDDFDGAASILDDKNMHFFKQVTDLSTVSDVFYHMVAFMRTFNDTAAFSETLVFDSTKLLSDVPIMSEQISKGLVKAPILHAYAVTDYPSLGAGLVKAETTQVSDAGSLRSQGYCDFTYFAEDYVGASRTF